MSRSTDDSGATRESRLASFFYIYLPQVFDDDIGAVLT